MTMEYAIRVGIDIGGTFTDVALVTSGGRVFTCKAPSTPADYGRGVFDGLSHVLAEAAEGGVATERLSEVVHGSTIATNAVLEQRGARTALITTRGFRDVLEIRRLRMPQLYNIAWDKPAPLAPRYLRFEMDERVGSDGTVIIPLDEFGLDRIVEHLRQERVQSVAVCLINSYANPHHEQRIKELLTARLPDLSVSISADIIQEISEFERTSTTVINAYVKPVVERYLTSLEAGLESEVGVTGRLLVMQSNGAVMTVEAAKRRPCYLIESGPAAGVIASHATAEAIGEPNIIAFDMGGTTAKASLLEDGRPALIDEYEIGGGITVGSRLMKGDGYLLRIPAIDLAEIGAGGGSVAWVDGGGALQVGPRSVGADPGPACYDAGNDEPTITDANVALGYISPETFAGGALKLNPDRSWEALERLGRQLQMSALEAAYAVHVIGNARMGRAIHAVSTARGRDVRGFTLLAFGGSGPIHAIQMARSLGMSRVIVPPHPGTFSALGLVFAEIGHEFVQTVRMPLDAKSEAGLINAAAAMRTASVDELQQLGYATDDLRFAMSADLRYVGQYFRLRVELPDHSETDNRQIVPELLSRFETEHLRRYGHRGDGDPIELVSLHLKVVAVDSTARRPLASIPVNSHRPGSETRSTTRMACFSSGEGFVETPVVHRLDLKRRLHGPLIVEEDDTTIIIPDGCCAILDNHANVIVQLKG